MISEYISVNQFRVEEDHTGEFKTGRRIKAYCGVDGYVYSTVLSSSYSDLYTTITIVENTLTSNLEDVLYGIVNIGETGAFPDHLHDGTEGQGGVLPYITATEFSTYSGTLQTQIDNKPDTFLELIDTPSSYDSGKYARSTSSGIVWTTAGSSNVQTFLDLTDTPTTYSGHTGKLLKVTSSGIEFIQLPTYNLFTAASGLPVADSGNPSDYYINFNTGDVYEYAKSGEYFETTRTNLSTMPHAVSHTLNGDPTYVSNGLGNQWWQDDINTNQWLSIDIGTAKPMYKIILAGGSDATDRVPKNFRIEGSSNNTDWNIVYTGITIMTAASQTFVFPSSSASYRYWRLYMIDNWGSALIQINRFELYSGRTSNTYVWQVRGNVRTPTFKDLTDVPYTYSGTAGKFAQSTGSGIVWATASGSGYWYDGYSTPSGSLGVVNDYYINSTTNKIYKKQFSGSTFFTAKSVIIDMTNNWTDGSYVGLRSVELYLSGSKVSTPLSALTGYDTSSSFDPIHAFKNEVSKTGGSFTDNGWTSDPGSITNQRIVCVFSSPVTFDSMVINNYHHSGGSTARGAKDINVYYSTDTITTATYGAAISNSALIFTGQLHQHAASDAADNQTLTLINNYSIGWNVVLNTVNSFSGLVDTPSTYSGTGGMFAQSTGSGIVWSTISGGGIAPITTGTKEDLSGGLVTETWGKNTGNMFSGFMDDTYIDRYNLDGSVNHSSATTLKFSNISYTDFNSMLFKFYIKDCIGSKNITSAVFKLYCIDASAYPVSVYRVLKNWVPSEVTWNNYKTGSAWNTAGCKAGTSYPIDDSSTYDYYDQAICTVPSTTLNQWFTMDITSIVQSWSQSNHKEYGIIVAGSTEQYSVGEVHSNRGSDGLRPKLEISYFADAQVNISTLLDGQIAITTGEYHNKYILKKSSAKWMVSDGNKYQLTSGLPTGTAFFINVGTRVYDIQASSWKEWTGSIWKSVETFIDLDDTPSTYSGTTGKFAQSTGSGIVWATVSEGIQTFLNLTDTPNSYSNGKFAQSTEDGIVWTTVSGVGTGTSYGELELSYSPNIVLDFTEYNLQSVILTGNTNFTFTNMTNGKPCVLNVIQDAQGGRSATFQSNIRWPQGVIPTTSSGSGLYDIFTFIQTRGTICGSCSAAFQLGS